MTINWPPNLIQEISYRRCILFLGAGVSACSTNDNGDSPKTWPDFLSDAINLIQNPSTEINDLISRLLSQKNYLMALQVIHNQCEPGTYGNYLRDVFIVPNYKPSGLHDIIKEIDSKLVITTNFDKIYDNLCNEHEYVVATYTETQKILYNIKSVSNIIIKAHGSIDDIDKIVFTQKQYYEAKKKYPEFYNLLHALFLTHTVVFLGYSLSDPDINLVLETVAGSNSPSKPHYIVVKEGIEDEIKRYWKDCYNISVLEYGPDHDKLVESLKELLARVMSYRVSKGMP